MLALVGFLTVLVVIALIMTKKVQTMVALILVPIISALIIGHGGELGGYISRGITNIAPTGVMFIFAILFFGILMDAGTFDPIIARILKVVGKDPIKIGVGTVILACLVHLDGSGASTFLIAIPALLPLYNKLGMSKGMLATLVALSAGTMNMLPWGGPTLRAVTALDSTVDQIFTPMIIPMAAGLLFVVAVAVFLGKKEKTRLATSLEALDLNALESADKEDNPLARPKLFLLNLAFIVVAVVFLMRGTLPPAVIFMIATCIALMVNYPNLKIQKERIDTHAKSALMMASTLFAAGAFIGIMTNSGMIEAMSVSIVNLIPDGLGGAFPVIVGIISMPASFLFDPDSFYFGIMPVLANAYEAFGGNPVMVARASIIGQMSLGFPMSPLTPATFLLIGLVGIDLGEHQKKTFIFAFLTTMVMLVVAIVIGSIAIAL